MRLFGLGPEEAWLLELEEFGALSEAHLEAERRKDYRAGVMTAWMVNLWTSGEPMKPSDFFPSLKEEEQGVDMDPETWALEDGEYMKAMVLGFGGTVAVAET